VWYERLIEFHIRNQLKLGRHLGQAEEEAN
jgi:hypothetical protein